MVDRRRLDRVSLHRPAAPGTGEQDLSRPVDILLARLHRFGGPVPVEGRVVDLPHRDQVHEVIALKGH